MNSFDFTTAVIDLAIDAGFELDEETYRKDVDDMRNGEVRDEWIMDVLDSLDWTYEDALDFLNSKLPNGLYYTVEYQSLFLEESDD
jgi:hypothetical protein